MRDLTADGEAELELHFWHMVKGSVLYVSHSLFVKDPVLHYNQHQSDSLSLSVNTSVIKIDIYISE